MDFRTPLPRPVCTVDILDHHLKMMPDERHQGQPRWAHQAAQLKVERPSGIGVPLGGDPCASSSSLSELVESESEFSSDDEEDEEESVSDSESPL